MLKFCKMKHRVFQSQLTLYCFVDIFRRDEMVCEIRGPAQQPHNLNGLYNIVLIAARNRSAMFANSFYES